MTPNRHITPEERAQWTSMAHVALLQCIGEAAPWSPTDYAFHGGTSLHLSWNSPRFSEDLDFLLSETAGKRLKTTMLAVGERLQQTLLVADPPLVATIKDRSTERMGNFRVTLNRPGVLGSVMVKAEFWLVPSTYLQSYQTSSRTPGVPANLGGARVRVDTMLPAATIESAYYDKLTAFATRSHLKWRDLFDLWWIDRQLSPETAANLCIERLQAHLSAYNTADGLSPGDALRRFAGMLDDRDQVADEALRDLKPFISESLWNSLWPKGIDAMIELAHSRALAVADQFDAEMSPEHAGSPAP
jgi:hypothetical protein